MMSSGKCSQCDCDASLHKVSNFVIRMEEEITALNTLDVNSQKLDKLLQEGRCAEEEFSKLLKAAAVCASFIRHHTIIKSRHAEDGIKSHIQELCKTYEDLYEKFKTKEIEAARKDVETLESLFCDEVRSNGKVPDCAEIEEVIKDLCENKSYGPIFRQIIAAGEGSPTTCIRFPDTVSLD
jgi:hypothetical protein